MLWNQRLPCLARPKKWLLAVAIILGVVPAYPQQVHQQYAKDNGYFYRFRANFEVTQTREKLYFDYVVACSIRLTRWRGGGLSDDSTLSPKAMAAATRDGHAVMVRTLQACSGLTSENYDVPPDVLPLVVWFDDVADLSIGVGYMTEAAYDNPLGKLKFLGARIDRATREEWELWREKSAKDYVQLGALPGPWGYDFPNPKPSDQPAYIRTCETFRRIVLPDDLRAKLRELWPEGRPRFWTLPSAIELNTVRGTVWSFIRKFGQGSLGAANRFGVARS